MRAGENVHNQRHFDNPIAQSFNHLFQLSAQTTISALRQQKHSLRSLEYVGSRFFVLGRLSFTNYIPRPREPGLDAGFADFDKLEEISLVGPCTAFERAVMSDSPPPNLLLLRYQCDNPLPPPSGRESYNEKDPAAQDKYRASLLPFFRAPSASIPASLEELVATYQRDHFARISFSRLAKETIRDRALALKRVYGVKLMVQYIESSSYYPPLL